MWMFEGKKICLQILGKQNKEFFKMHFCVILLVWDLFLIRDFTH